MQGATWVLLVALMVYATSLLIHRSIEGRWSMLRLPLTWFYASWLLGLALLALPLYQYNEVLNGESAAYLIGVLTAFSVGTVGAAFWNQRGRLATAAMPTAGPSDSAPASDTGLDVSPRLQLVLLLLGLVGTTLLLANSVLGGSLSLADRLDAGNFAAIRLEHMAAGESKIGLLYGPANLMSSIGGLGVIFVFYLRGARAGAAALSSFAYRLALLVLAVNVVVGFIGFGSRMFAVFAVLGAFLAFAQGRWAIGERLMMKRLTGRALAVIVLSSLVTLAALWTAATVFLEHRVQRQDPQTLLFRTHRASFHPLIYDLTRTDVASQYFMFSLSYVTTPIPTLTYYIDLPDGRQPGPFFGEYNFPAPFRWGRRLSFTTDPYAWEKARYEIFKPLGDIGFGTNVWSTMVRDLAADFTKSGALLFLAVLGWFSQRVFDRQQAQPSTRRAGLQVYLCLIFIFSGFISVLFLPQIYWPLYLALFLALRSGRKKGQHVPHRGLPRAGRLSFKSF